VVVVVVAAVVAFMVFTPSNILGSSTDILEGVEVTRDKPTNKKADPLHSIGQFDT
jgi:hypothetical protein